MFTKQFWKETAERAAKSAAQAAIGLWVGDKAFDAFSADWKLAGGVALGGAILSVIFSIASLRPGEPDSPSAVRVR